MDDTKEDVENLLMNETEAETLKEDKSRQTKNWNLLLREKGRTQKSESFASVHSVQ